MGARGAIAFRPPAGLPAGAPRVLAIVPAKDEAKSLPGVLAALGRVQPPADTLVVDDGSRDATAETAQRAGCRVVSHAFNLGYGAALLTGYHWALRHGYSHVVQLDADGQHPPESIPTLLAPLLSGEADLVVGSRYLAGATDPGGLARRMASKGMAWLAKVWTRQPITDPTSGFQALSPAALALLCSDGLPDDYPDVDVLIDLHRAGIRIREVPVAMSPRRHGVSMHRGLRVLYYFYRLGVCLLLLPVRRRSPWRHERQEAA